MALSSTGNTESLGETYSVQPIIKHYSVTSCWQTCQKNAEGKENDSRNDVGID